jgi:chemotaxis protein methyltransferase CheR
LEEGIYDKSVIYSTELTEASLHKTQDGLFPMNEVEHYDRIYQRGGGRAHFSVYYSPGEESAMFDTALRKNIVFGQHSFATDSSFNEFNAIFCRTSLRVFERSAQERAHKLFYDSLVLFGVLGLTPEESLEWSPARTCFAELDRDHNLYRKIM